MPRRYKKIMPSQQPIRARVLLQPYNKCIYSISNLPLIYKSMPFLNFSSGSFAVPTGDHFLSGIICDPIWGSFAVRDHLRSWDHLRTRTVYVMAAKDREGVFRGS